MLLIEPWACVWQPREPSSPQRLEVMQLSNARRARCHPHMGPHSVAYQHYAYMHLARAQCRTARMLERVAAGKRRPARSPSPTAAPPRNAAYEARRRTLLAPRRVFPAHVGVHVHAGASTGRLTLVTDCHGRRGGGRSHLSPHAPCAPTMGPQCTHTAPLRARMPRRGCISHMAIPQRAPSHPTRPP